MTFAEQFRDARQNAGLSQASIADKTGIPRRTIENWEAGKNTPPEWAQRMVLKELAGLAKKPKGDFYDSDV